MAILFDDGFLEPWAETSAQKRAADELRKRLAASAEAQQRINTPTLPTQTPTLSQPDYIAQAPPFTPPQVSSQPGIPVGAETGPPTSVAPYQQQSEALAALQAMVNRNPATQNAFRIASGFRPAAEGLIGGAIQGLTPTPNAVPADVQRVIDEGSGQALQRRGVTGESTPFGGTLPNMEQRLGRTGGNPFLETAGFAGEMAGRAVRPAGSVLGPSFGALDQAVGKPLDAYSETGWDATTAFYDYLSNPEKTVRDTRSAVAGAKDYAGGVSNAFIPRQNAGPQDSMFGRLAESTAPNPTFLGDAYNKQVGDFRDRPLWQQFVLGSAYGPEIAIPGASFADDIASIGGAIGRKIPRAGREVAEAGARQAITPPAGMADEVVQAIGGGSIHTAPGPRAHGGVAALPPTESVKGNMLGAEDLLVSKPDYTVRDALRVADDLERQTEAIANQVQSRIRTGVRKLGALDKDHTHLRAVDGVWVSIYDAAENPSAYVLTPRQREGLAELGQIVSDVRAEREIFDIPPQLVDVADDGSFIPRSVKSTSQGDIERGTGGARLSASKREGSRVVERAADAEAIGTVYQPIERSIEDYARRWTRAAAQTHVRNLLVPFAETSSMRVTPALRDQMQTLKSMVRQLDALGKGLDDRQREALRAFLEADSPDIDALRDVIDTIRVTRGRFAGEDVANLRRIRDETKQQIRQMAPEWRKALNNSRSPRPGRVMASGDLTPALRELDFDKADWNRIARHYGRTAPRKPWAQQQLAERGVTVLREGFNVPVRFVNATLDLSAILRQQSSALTRHPATTARNIMRSFKDTVDARTYDEFVGGEVGQKWARRGAAIFGDEGGVDEFMASGWTGRIPGIKQANNHFIRYNTRNRLDHMELAEQWLSRKVGRPITEDEGRQIANALNRATGVSRSRGASLESDLLFAARYTRAGIEDVAKAIAGGGVEGALARQYLGSLLGVTMMASVTSALVNGIPLDEVLNPFDRRALRQGEIRMNPNFLSVRAFGHDLKPLGSYDSLARIGFVLADSATGAITEKDASKLLDFVGYVTETKGSPVVSLITNMVKGEDFHGDDPLSRSSLLRRVAPFSSEAYAEAVTNPSLETILGGGFEALGEKAAPLSFSDKRDQVAMDLFGERYIDLLPEQRTAVQNDPRYPTYEGPDDPDSAGSQIAVISGQAKEDMATIAADLAANRITPTAYVDARREIINDATARIRQEAEKLDDPQLKDAVDVFSDIIEKNTSKKYSEQGLIDEVDWAGVEADLGRLRPSLQKTIEENVGLGYDDTDRKFRSDMAEIADTKVSVYMGPGYTLPKTSYFDIDKTAWRHFGSTYEDLVGKGVTEGVSVKPGLSFEAFWSELYTQLANKYGPLDGLTRYNKLRGRYDQTVGDIKRKYRIENPEIQKILQEWQFAGTGRAEVVNSQR